MKETAKIYWSSASRTDVGNVRKLNEDSVLELAGRGVWAVADGMGGHAAGDVASRAVVDALANVTATDSLGGLLSDVRQRLQSVNRALNQEARSRRVQVIGSTVVALLTFGSHAVVVWAGDSRAYLYRQGQLTQLTRDHSQVQELVNQGLITSEQAEHHPASNMITRAVGVADELELDSEMVEVREGDSFLLCSDGLYNEVNRSEIAESLVVGDCRQSCDLLVKQALAHGARDNVSVVVVRAVDEGQITRTQLNPSTAAAARPDTLDEDPTRLD